MKVRDIMVEPPVVLRETATLEEVARTMLDRGIGCVPLVDESGKLKGIITESDFTGKERGLPLSAYLVPQIFGEWVSKGGIERIYKEARARTASEIMTEPVITAAEDESVTEVAVRMIQRNLKRLPVVRDGVLVGVVTRHDLLKLMARS